MSKLLDIQDAALSLQEALDSFQGAWASVADMLDEDKDWKALKELLRAKGKLVKILEGQDLAEGQAHVRALQSEADQVLKKAESHACS